jgi:AcrR family transcriptional regulator
MRSRVKPRRAYHSPRRAAQARSTRQSILDAASALFIDQGFVATTISAIASRAGTSAETVYATFGSKRLLLAELVDASIAGGSGAPPVMDQDWVADLRAEPDPRRRLRILTTNGARILARRSALDEVVHSAASADAELAALWDRLKAERYAGQRALLQLVLAGQEPLAAVDLETAVDILYALGSPETYRLLVVDRGWSDARFEQWYAETVERLTHPGE